MRMLGWPRWRPAWNTTPASSTCRLIPAKAFGFSSGGAHTPQAWRREGCQRSHPKMGLFGHDQFRDWGPRTLRALPELECIDLVGQVAAVQ